MALYRVREFSSSYEHYAAGMVGSAVKMLILGPKRCCEGLS